MYDLSTNKCLEVGNRVKISKPEHDKNERQMNPVYRQLMSAGDYLSQVIAHNEGGANKDLTKFTEELIALCQKWDR